MKKKEYTTIIPVRLNKTQKDTIVKASKVDLKSGSVSAFVRNASLDKAKKILKESKS